MDEAEFFAPWRLVAAFADGSRLLFDGLTEDQAREAMEAAQEQHGDIGYWNRVTDQNYEDGSYYLSLIHISAKRPRPTTPAAAGSSSRTSTTTNNGERTMKGMTTNQIIMNERCV